MDRQGFRIASTPDLVRQPPRAMVGQETRREINATKTTPAPDSRFSGYAAPLDDGGRMITDWRDKCVTRAPPGQNFAVKQWTVHQASDIIRITHEREVQSTGHALGTANTILPPAVLQTCDTTGCRIESTSYANGLGIERTDIAPPLFGTFGFPPTPATLARNKNHIALNKTIGYGRNTPTRWEHLYQ